MRTAVVDARVERVEHRAAERGNQRAVARFIGICLLLSVHEKIDSEVFVPYLYTRVACCPPALPSQYLNMSDGDADLGCAAPPRPPEDEQWSHSSHCVSFSFVRDRAQQVNGVYGSLKQLATIAILPSAGALGDQLGRKTILYAATAGPLVASLFWAADAAGWGGGSDLLVYLGAAAQAVFQLAAPIQAAMLADLVSERRRGLFFPVLQAVKGTAPLLAQLMGIVVLGLRLQQYGWCGCLDLCGGGHACV